MSQPIDTAHVEIVPDVDRFAAQLKAKLDRALRGLSKDIDRSLGDVDRSFARTALRAGGHGERAGDNFGRQFVRAARGALSGLGTALLLGGKGLVGLAAVGTIAGGVAAALGGLASAAGGVIPVIAGLASALVSAAGAAAALPGVIGILVGVIATLKIGMSGLKDAFKAVGEGDAAKLDEALAKLAPSARAFVKEVAKIKPAFDKMRLGVQERLFAGTARTLHDLAVSTLPVLTAGFNAVAEALNRRVVAAFTELNTQANRQAVAATFTAAATAVSRLGAALAPVGRALVNLVAVGAQVTAELSGGVASAIGTFADKITALAQSGGLAKIMTDGLAVLGQFAGLAGDVLGIVRGIFAASGTAADGGGLFAFFDRLNQLINRPDVQAALKSVFADLAALGVALTPVLVALVKALVPVAEGIGEIAVAFAPSLTALVTALGTALGSLAPGFVALAPLVDALARGLQPVADILVGLVEGAAPGLAALLSGLVSGLSALAPAAVPVGQALGAVAAALAPLLPVLGTLLADALTVLATALSGIARAAAPVIEVLANMLTTALRPLLPAFLALAGAFVTALLPHLPALIDAFEQLVPPLMHLAQVIGAQLAQMIIDLIPYMPVLVAQLVDLALAGLRLTAALLPVIEALAPLLLNSGALQLAMLLLGGAIEITIVSWNFAAAAVEKVVGWFRTATDTAGNLATGIKQGFGSAVNVVQAIPGQVRSALGSVGSLLFDAGRNIITGLINGITSAFGALRDKLGQVTRLIPDWKGPMETDRRLLVPTGQAIVEGLGVGMAAATADLRRQLQGLTGDIGLTVGGGSAAAAGGGQVVTVNVGGVHFSGAVTEEQASTTGQAVGAGIADALSRRSVRTAVRTV